MLINLYLVEVRDLSNKPIDYYYYLTNKILTSPIQKKSYSLSLKFLSQLISEPEKDFYSSLKFFFSKRNIDCYYLNTFTKEHFYMPAVHYYQPLNELPMSHTYPSLKIAGMKQSKIYKELTYKGNELIIERPIYNLGLTPKSLFEDLNSYLKTPNAKYYYNYYLKIYPDSFKCFLMVIRDYLTTTEVKGNLFLYSYMGSFQMLGYYPKFTLPIKEWYTGDRGKDLRQNLILLPFTMSPLIALWTMFTNNIGNNVVEDIIS